MHCRTVGVLLGLFSVLLIALYWNVAFYRRHYAAGSTRRPNQHNQELAEKYSRYHERSRPLLPAGLAGLGLSAALLLACWLA